ncbi:NYN domain-containing protein [Nodosilinea sp. PGN35]
MQRAKINALLQQKSDVPRLLKAVDHSLEKFFTPNFQQSKAHGQFLQRLQKIVAAQTHQSDNAGSSGGDSRNFIKSEPSGLLLVDAENINLTEDLEKYLQTVGQYPIRHRLAFGNWCRLGGRDKELHRRGYQMVHVPSGKNSADIKMSLDASVISLWNPSIREVFICSTDTDLQHLSHTLLNLGILPYRVSQHNNSFSIFDVAQQKTQVVHLSQETSKTPNKPLTSDSSIAEASNHQGEVAAKPEAAKTPTLAEMSRWLKIIVLQEQQANPDQPITISRLGKLFRDRNQISANQVLKANSDYKTLTQFLMAHSGFELLPLPDGSQTEVRLKPAAPEQSSAASGNAQAAKGATAQKITDAQSLEQALVKLLWSLSSGQSSSQIDLGVINTQFANVHGEPLSNVLKRIGEPKGLPKFFAKCSSLRIQKHGKSWRVAVVCVG